LFGGETLPLVEAALLVVYPNVESNESQQLFCHKEHLAERILKEIPLHPDFFE
jgi:hypothetical protein